jgi:SPASM domain peptide maturase of grasp-with-spasm system
MINDHEVFKLFANCLAVKGARRSAICDLQRHRMQFIPNDLFEILTEYKGLPVAEIKRRCGTRNEQIIDSYFDLLVKKGYGFWCDEPDRFQALDLSWKRAGKITNAIIDIDRSSTHDYRDIFLQLDGLGCQAIQLRAYDCHSIEELDNILHAVQQLPFRHIDLILKYHPGLTHEVLSDLCVRHQLISRVSVHSSPESSRSMAYSLPVSINFYTQVVTPESCGEVSPKYFSLGLEHFTEAHHFNSCLNRKISICADGEIKNCPAMQQSLGNLRSTRLAQAANHPALVQIGSITKDQVSVCRDCEFRYVCTDCRAYTKDPGDLYSKPAKCSYDPYTATWGRRAE